MPKTVVLWDGTTVSVPDDVADKVTSNGNNARLESPEEGLERVHANAESDRHSFNWGDEFKSAAESALTGGLYGGASPLGGSSEWQQQLGEGARDIASFGLAGRASDELGGEEAAYTNRAERQAHPWARMAGEIGGAIATGGLAPTSELEGAAKLGARAVEGAAFGASGHIAQANVTGDPLTIEGTVEAAGTGAIMNLAFGFAGDALGAGISKAANYAADARAAREVFNTAEEGGKIFEDEANGSAYSAFTDAHEAGVKAAQKFNRAVDKAADEWGEWTSGPDPAKKALKAFDDIQNELREQMVKARDSAYWKTAGKDYESAGAVADATEAPYRELSNAIKNGTDEVRGLLKAGDYEGAANRIRALSESIKPGDSVEAEAGSTVRGKVSAGTSTPGFGDLSVPKVPAPPPDPLPVSSVELPGSLSKFARMTNAKVTELAGELGASKDAASIGAFQRLADQLGVKGDSVPDLVAGVQSKLAGYSKAIDDVAAMAKVEGQATGLVPILKRAFRRGAASAGGALIGGAFAGPFGVFAGAFGGKLAGDAIGSAMEGAESSLLDATLMSGKVGAKEKIANLIAATAPIAKNASTLGVASDILGTSLWSGMPDPRANEKKARELARDRMKEIATAATTGPDAFFQSMRGVIGHSSDAAFKIASHMMQAINYLNSTIPKDPGNNRQGLQSNWLPSHADTAALAARMEAFLRPMSAAQRVLSGDGHPAGSEALRTMWPALMSEVGAEATMSPALADVSYMRASSYSQLLGANLSALSDSSITNILQGSYLPKPQPQPSLAKQSGPNGRPAKVQTPLAGTSPGNLVADSAVT